MRCRAARPSSARSFDRESLLAFEVGTRTAPRPMAGDATTATSGPDSIGGSRTQMGGAPMDHFRDTYLHDIVRTYRNYKTLGEKALAQIPDRHLHTELDASSNSVAVIIKHVAGNLRSRFTEFLTTDGEKPDRNRDGEFEMVGQARREDLLRWW